MTSTHLSCLKQGFGVDDIARMYGSWGLDSGAGLCMQYKKRMVQSSFLLSTDALLSADAIITLP